MMIDKMDYIFAIAKEQNLTRAAKRLFVAQSTLTMYLNRVERELGIKLFDRSKTPIQLTPAGALCIEELKKIRQIETRLTARLQQMAHPEETLNVGIGLMHGAAWMPSLLPLFHEIYPSVSINLIEQGDELLMQSLRSNDADLVVGGMTPGSQETSVDLALEQLLLIVPRSFNLVPPWAYSGNSAENPYEITPKQIQNLPLILPSAASPSRHSSISTSVRSRSRRSAPCRRRPCSFRRTWAICSPARSFSGCRWSILHRRSSTAR